jgi:arsenate reductase
MEEQQKKTVLFLSVHNAVRSQMAEGLLKHFRGDMFEAFSAGVEEAELSINAISVMQEIGIDISHYHNKKIDFFAPKQFDFVISIYASASEDKPDYPNGTTHLDWDFADPGKTSGTPDVVLDAFRKFRDDLTKRIQDELFSGS